MRDQIQKSLQECLTRIKILNKQIRRPVCRRSKTASIAVDEDGGDDAATLSDIDRFLFENFGSLYREDYEQRNEAETTTYILDSPPALQLPLENLRRSGRFFVASGSSSPWIVDCAFSSGAAPDGSEGRLRTPSPSDDFIVLLTRSTEPHEDFRRSMEEIAEAHLKRNGKVDWEFLDELLHSYLDLNSRNAHKFILRAFVDLVVALRENPRKIPVSRRVWRGGAMAMQPN